MSVLPDMRHGNITVIGDVMLDRFWSGASRRVSPEAPVPVVNVSGQEDRAGGAGNVAVNLAELGVTVSLVGLCGDDEHARALRSCIESAGVRWNVMPCKAFVTDGHLKVAVGAGHDDGVLGAHVFPRGRARDACVFDGGRL